MKKKETIQLIVCVLLATAGGIGSNWYPKTGMFICGSFSMLSIMASIGLYLKNLVAARIDKRMKEYIQNKA